MDEQRRQFVLSLIAYGVQRGVEAGTLCDEAGLDLSSLRQDRNIVVGENAMHRLWAAAVRLTEDPLFGLHFGESLQLAALGAAGEIIKNSETVGQALTMASTLTPIVTTLYTMDVRKEAEQVSVVFNQIKYESEEITRQVADFMMVFTIHELGGFLLRRAVPSWIDYPYPLQHLNEYARVLHQAPVRAGNTLTISFDPDIWTEPVMTANFEVQRFFLDRIGQLTSAVDTSSFQAVIMNHLLKNAFHGIPSLEHVAANFNVTSRSLQRRLQEEGTTFQQIVDAVRKTLALHYLESGKYKVKEISSLLGYNEISAFSRAFKRWTGQAPASYSA